MIEKKYHNYSLLIDYILFINVKNFAKFQKLKFIIILIFNKIKGEKFISDIDSLEFRGLEMFRIRLSRI